MIFDTAVFHILVIDGTFATIWGCYNMYHLLAYLSTRHCKEIGGVLPSAGQETHQKNEEEKATEALQLTEVSVVYHSIGEGGWKPDPNVTYPMVTIQATAYNELDCIELLLRNLSKIYWPRDRLQIQLLDDSTLPEAVELADRVILDLKKYGVNIEHCRRENRIGYKAGNLLHHFPSVRGEYLAIFDADFLPYQDFLLQTIPHFFDKDGNKLEDVGLVQGAWDHFNQTDNLFTQAQGLISNFHFIIQQNVRCRRCEFFPFNGTAGVWRTVAIERSGNWNYDTVTEDLDMACRASLKGYRFVFLEHVTVPSELPPTMFAYKRQQRRWTHGHMQVARKIIRAVWKSPFVLRQKIDITHLLLHKLDWIISIIALLVVPLLGFTHLSPREQLVVGFFGGFNAVVWTIIMIVTLREKKFMNPDMSLCQRLHRIYVIPFFISLQVGMTFWQLVGVIEGLIQNDIPFATTPKSGRGAQLDKERLLYLANMDDTEVIVGESEGKFKEMNFEGWDQSVLGGTKTVARRRKPGCLSKSFPNWAHFAEFAIACYLAFIGMFYEHHIYAIPLIFLSSGFFWVSIPGIRSSAASLYSRIKKVSPQAGGEQRKESFGCETDDRDKTEETDWSLRRDEWESSLSNSGTKETGIGNTENEDGADGADETDGFDDRNENGLSTSNFDVQCTTQTNKIHISDETDRRDATNDKTHNINESQC